MYIILRDENAPFNAPALRPLEGFGRRPLEGPNFERAPLVAPPAPQIETAELTPAETRDALHDPSVRAIARAMPTRLIAPLPADAASPATWGVAAIGADTSPFDGAGVRVAVLDTGIDEAHPAFAGVTLTTRDFSGDGIHDQNGHGTHCAGTIFGRPVDGTRIGVAPGVTDALIGKVLGDDGSGSSEMLFNALKWCSDANAQVVSMSLGFDFPGLAADLQGQGLPPELATSIALEGYRMNLRMFDALMDMLRAQADFNGGTIVCAAAGNESRRDIDPAFEVSVSVPAAAFGVVSVGALGETAGGLAIADFSNTNPTLSGPGVNILSAATGGGLVAFNGTSMACPHVAGTAALWWQAQRSSGSPATAAAVRARLLASATASGIVPATDPIDRGQGLVQAPTNSMV